jgi:glycosyltransferase involved in cell wall biosynthesis
LLFEAKQGAYAARNRGLQEAEGKVIAFTDADCVPSQDWLHEIMMAMGQPGLRIALGQAEFVGGSMLLSMLAAYEDEKRNYLFNSRRKELYFGQTNNMAVEKKLFDELGPFVERARGGDTIFVRQVVNKYTCEVVRYCPQIRVRHLEMDSLSQLYRKCFIYARSRQGYRRVVEVKWLSNRERLHVFRSVVQNRGYSWMESLIFLGLLGIAVAYWGLGHISLAWREKEPVK